MMILRTTLAVATATLLAFAGTSGASADDDDDDNACGSVKGKVLCTAYDGVSDDLLTAGLGKEGLASPTAPGFANPASPTVAELRRLAIYSNYRALVDTSAGGGYGTLYGPNVAADGTVTGEPGLIAGLEFIAYAGSARENVTMMVQVPAGFDPGAPCIVTAPSSGSRGVYGAIGTAGEWGLKNGCAVAYTDKGTGMGAHDLQDNTVGLITGKRDDAKDAGRKSNFTARLGRGKREAFNAATPDRFAWKHAHSRLNPERDWGRDVLRSVKFAFEVLNREFPEAEITPDNTIVIASSVSNGGGASLRAAEQDKGDLIDGIAVSEPNVNPVFDPRFVIVQEGSPEVERHSRSLYDYTTLLNVYQGCASAGFPAFELFNFAPSPARCESLHVKGLLTRDTLPEQIAEAQRIINDYGILPEQNPVQPSHWFLYVPQAIAVTYANAYGRVSVTENLCGYSFGATDPAPAPLSAAAEAALFATGNGIPPTGGVNLINNDAPGGPLEDRASTSDQNLAGALCLRALATGRDPVTGARLTGKAAGLARRIAKGIAQIRAHGDLDGKPTIIVTGRADAILPLNHTSRAYFGLNRLAEGEDSRLSYIEVLNAQHLDVLNGFAGFNERFIPLHHYFIQALDLMFDHLKHGIPLPASQLVRTTPRGTGAPPPPLTLANLPAIAAEPDAGSRIIFTGDEVRIPE